MRRSSLVMRVYKSDVVVMVLDLLSRSGYKWRRFELGVGVGGVVCELSLDEARR